MRSERRGCGGDPHISENSAPFRWVVRRVWSERSSNIKKLQKWCAGGSGRHSKQRAMTHICNLPLQQASPALSILSEPALLFGNTGGINVRDVFRFADYVLQTTTACWYSDSGVIRKIFRAQGIDDRYFTFQIQ